MHRVVHRARTTLTFLLTLLWIFHPATKGDEFQGLHQQRCPIELQAVSMCQTGGVGRQGSFCSF